MVKVYLPKKSHTTPLKRSISIKTDGDLNKPVESVYTPNFRFLPLKVRSVYSAPRLYQSYIVKETKLYIGR